MTVPGEILHDPDPVTILDGLPLVEVEVRNTGDRPIQVGSHYHFAEANPALEFDRELARGRRLAIPAGTAVRFEPGFERTVALVELGGARIVRGLRNAVAGPLDVALEDPSASIRRRFDEPSASIRRRFDEPSGAIRRRFDANEAGDEA